MTTGESIDLERELKFVLPAGRAEFVARWLAAVCRPDPAFPEAEVWTVYYDGPGWPSLGEKLNSDYLKLKVRLRFYAGIGQPPAGPAFLEAKARIGTRREKRRVLLSMDAGEIATQPLDGPVLQALPSLLAVQGVIVPLDWVPMVTLKYVRSRFIEPASNARIALDRHIAPIATNRGHLVMLNPGPLGDAVLEVKGHENQLPSRLEAALSFGARKQTFSKYLAVWNHITRTRQ